MRCDLTYMWNLKTNKGANKAKWKRTCQHREQMAGCQRRVDGGRWAGGGQSRDDAQLRVCGHRLGDRWGCIGEECQGVQRKVSGTYPVEEHTRSDNDGAHVKFAGGLQELDRAKRPHFHLSLSCTGEGNGTPLQCSCLENPRDGVAQSRTWLKWLSSKGQKMMPDLWPELLLMTSSTEIGNTVGGLGAKRHDFKFEHGVFEASKWDFLVSSQIQMQRKIWV